MVQNCLHALEKKFVFRFAGTFHLFFTQKADCLSILATRNGKNSINVSIVTPWVRISHWWTTVDGLTN